jgi:hypothetical protein
MIFIGILKKEIKKMAWLLMEIENAEYYPEYNRKNKVTILHHDLIAQEDFSTSFITI